MVDTEKLRRLVKNYEFHSKPSNGNPFEPCTIKDLDTVISNTAKLLYAFIDELENKE